MATEKAKSNSVVTHRITEHGVVFTVKGAGQAEDGTVTDAELAFTLALASQENRRRAELHGWIQRISDAAAISRDTKTGKPASAAEKLAAMAKLVEHYQSGTQEWRLAGSGGGLQAESVLLVKCLQRIYTERTEAQLREWVGKRSASERAALLASEKIKPIADEIRAQSAQGVDSEALLGELG